VVSGGPAEAAGMKRGDIILSFNGKNIKNMSDLPLIVAETPVGQTVPVVIMREGKQMTLNLKLAEMPEEKAAKAPAEKQPAEASFGMSVENITPRMQKQLNLTDKTGVVVVDVAQGSAADDAGIEEGDVIKEINRTPVRNVEDYQAAIAKAKKGGTLLFLVKRGDMTFFASIKP